MVQLPVFQKKDDLTLSILQRLRLLKPGENGGGNFGSGDFRPKKSETGGSGDILFHVLNAR